MTTKLRITQVKSRIGAQKRHKETLDALGIRRNYTTVYRDDNPVVRGMLKKIRHLVRWEEVDEKSIPEKAEKSSVVTVISGGGKEKKDTGDSKQKSDKS